MPSGNPILYKHYSNLLTNKQRIEGECSDVLATVCGRLKTAYSFENAGNRTLKWEFLSEPRIYKCSVSQAFDMELIRDLIIRFHICVTIDTNDKIEVYINDENVGVPTPNTYEQATQEFFEKVRCSFEGLTAALAYR